MQAKDAYEPVVEANPDHAKVLQHPGWLYHQDGSSFQNQELLIQHLTKSLEAGKLTCCWHILRYYSLNRCLELLNPSDAQSWYFVGRAYMAG